MGDAVFKPDMKNVGRKIGVPYSNRYSLNLPDIIWNKSHEIVKSSWFIVDY